MSGQGALIALLLASGGAPRWVFTGDVMLARGVGREIALRGGASPWLKMRKFFAGADLVMGNLEGSVGEPEDCLGEPCFAVQVDALRFPKAAGFTALGLENNHIADLGPDGPRRTREALVQARISPITFQGSPTFFKSQGHVLSLIAVSNVKGKDGRRTEVPSDALRQKLRLARSLSDWVVVSIHWGAELADWPQPKQREMAKWLIAQGADLIIGHHPHVVEPPECVDGRPVFFSLGNHVFDQKYPETKQGLIAECTVEEDQLTCAGVATTTGPRTSFPEVQAAERKPVGECRVPKPHPLVIGGYTVRPKVAEGRLAGGAIVLEGTKEGAGSWTAPAPGLLSIAAARLGNPEELLLSLEAHHSSIDREIGPRPYVYAVGPRGPVAKWRGSALAWPLIDAELLHATSEDLLCALHRGDSFIKLNPATTETRTAVYRWNGFGFSGVEDAALNDQCRRAFTGGQSTDSASAGAGH
ncbi:MAG TPA: CapA family protein [Myxococcaceae bacterium]|nr:CapA family protein [Myxococcaceae bacterium]